MKRVKFLGLTLAVVASFAALFVLGGCAQQQAYTPPQTDPVISSPTISQDGVLRVGIDTSNAPLAGTSSSSGNMVGIDVDVASALADELGLKVEFVDVGTDAAGALKDGKVDIAMGINKASATGDFWVSDQYLDSSVVLFATNSGAPVPSASSTDTFAAQVSSTSSWAVTNEFEKATLQTQSDLKSCFDMLSSGSVDYVASDAVKGLYTASRNSLDLSIVACMQSVSGYGIGVTDTNATLKQAVSSALSTITSNGVVDVIETKWLGEVLDLSRVELTEGAKSTNATTDTAAATEGSDSAEAATETGEATEATDAAAAEATATGEAAATEADTSAEAAGEATASADASASSTEASASTDAATQAAAADASTSASGAAA